VTASGIRFEAPAVILTVGTFLGGRIHVGLDSQPGGRAGDAPSNRLAARLRELPLGVGRLKTGTPPRIDGRTLDRAAMLRQPGDHPTPVFSFLGRDSDHPKQVDCFITHTNERTHDIIRAATDRSPMFTGLIEGVGPRYCPSVEDKVVRFADKTSHQVFIEPEGLGTHEVYPNGISTSLPFDVQVQLVHSIRGCEDAHLTRPGYAIEYDFFDPRGLRPTLETRVLAGLYFAGQINGTTGYEEAAAQGLMAGINAALALRGDAAFTPRRSEAYLGVLVDDLVTRGATEPYRMFTSRAEHRLILREDNADLRLTPLGRQLGLVGDERWALFEAKARLADEETARLAGLRVRAAEVPAAWSARVLGQPLPRDASALELLRRPGVSHAALCELTGAPPWAQPGAVDERLPREVRTQVEVRAKYAGYIERQQAEIERARRHEETTLPQDLDYERLAGLSHEVRQKLGQARTATLGQAARVPGVTPAAVQILLVHLKRRGAKAHVA
jgi:tRNA uridine 5-carboxymethylaminomethyl modification enzyme